MAEIRNLEGRSQEELDPAVIGRDDQCKLGKWIYGPAQRYFPGAQILERLRTAHAQFHLYAGSVVKKVQDNDRPGR